MRTQGYRTNVETTVALVMVAVLLAGCGSSRKASKSGAGWGGRTVTQAEQAGDQLEAKVQALRVAYNAGDCAASRTHLHDVFSTLQGEKYPTFSAKLAYLEKEYDLKAGERTFVDLAIECQFNPYSTTSSVTMTETQALPEASESTPSLASLEPIRPSELRGFLKAELSAAMRQLGNDPNVVLPPDFIDEIERYVVRYQTQPKFKAFFERSVRRSRKYVPLLAPYFKEIGYPEALIIGVGVQESGFNMDAYSHAGAQGGFQFMRGTAREVGLKVNRATDERYAPLKAGVAFRDYLHKLHQDLGDMPLALAAYNGGWGRARRGIKQLNGQQPATFWYVSTQTKTLPKETREYVPQVLAAMIAGQPGTAARLGFEDVPYPNPSTYELVLVPQQTKLDVLAAAAGVSVQGLVSLNPDLTGSDTTTPRRVIEYPLFVPIGTAEAVRQTLRSGKGQITKPRPSSSSKRQSTVASNSAKGPLYIRYKVQRGNTLSQISQWFGKSQTEIKGWNSYLKQRGLREGDIVFVRELPSDWVKVTHTVKRGETLSAIARRHGLSIAEVRNWNGIQGDTLRVGQSLVLYSRQRKT